MENPFCDIERSFPFAGTNNAGRAITKGASITNGSEHVVKEILNRTRVNEEEEI